MSDWTAPLGNQNILDQWSPYETIINADMPTQLFVLCDSSIFVIGFSTLGLEQEAIFYQLIPLMSNLTDVEDVWAR